MFQTPNRIDWQPLNMILSCRLLSSQKTQTKLESKLPNKIEVSDIEWVIDDVVEVQREPGWLVTIMLHSYMHPTM